MIESITIKSTASYDTAGVCIDGLKKINYIYGSNGSGKTTISNLISNQSDNQYQACEVSWQRNEEINCLVYNKNFRDKNLGTGKIAGVFTLGQATKAELKAIEEKQAELKELKEKNERGQPLAVPSQ